MRHDKADSSSRAAVKAPRRKRRRMKDFGSHYANLLLNASLPDHTEIVHAGDLVITGDVGENCDMTVLDGYIRVPGNVGSGVRIRSKPSWRFLGGMLLGSGRTFIGPDHARVPGHMCDRLAGGVGVSITINGGFGDHVTLRSQLDIDIDRAGGARLDARAAGIMTLRGAPGADSRLKASVVTVRGALSARTRIDGSVVISTGDVAQNCTLRLKPTGMCLPIECGDVAPGAGIINPTGRVESGHVARTARVHQKFP